MDELKSSKTGEAKPGCAPANGSGATSLRDMFAVQAISLFPLSERDVSALQNGETPNHRLVAKFCYELADAMMAERQNGSG